MSRRHVSISHQQRTTLFIEESTTTTTRNASLRAVFAGRYMIQNKAPSPGSIARPFSDIDSKRPENVLWPEEDVDVITRAVVHRV